MEKTRPVAIVTGASRGIGKAIAVHLAAAGYNIAGISRSMNTPGSAKNTAELESLVKGNGSDFKPYSLDIGDVMSHQEIIDKIMNEFGRIDLLVNNAGVAPFQRYCLR